MRHGSTSHHHVPRRPPASANLSSEARRGRRIPGTMSSLFKDITCMFWRKFGTLVTRVRGCFPEAIIIMTEEFCESLELGPNAKLVKRMPKGEKKPCSISKDLSLHCDQDSHEYEISYQGPSPTKYPLIEVIRDDNKKIFWRPGLRVTRMPWDERTPMEPPFPSNFKLDSFLIGEDRLCTLSSPCYEIFQNVEEAMQ